MVTYRGSRKSDDMKYFNMVQWCNNEISKQYNGEMEIWWTMINVCNIEKYSLYGQLFDEKNGHHIWIHHAVLFEDILNTWMLPWYCCYPFYYDQYFLIIRVTPFDYGQHVFSLVRPLFLRVFCFNVSTLETWISGYELQQVKN